MTAPGRPEPPDSAWVPSPCIRVCMIDPATGLCRGCRRTLEEISSWSALPAEEKRALLEALRAR